MLNTLHSIKTLQFVPAARTQFRCSTDQSCVSYLSVCDGTPDCADSSDEASCAAQCSALEFRSG